MRHSVLLVEDDKNIAAVITEALHDEGFEVTRCATIVKRDSLLADNSFDVMLTGEGAGWRGEAGARRRRRAYHHRPGAIPGAHNAGDCPVGPEHAGYSCPCKR